MKKIYERASHVYVCLGESRNAWLAMAMLNDLVLTYMTVSPESFSLHVKGLYALRLNEQHVSVAARAEAFYELLSNPWFTRVWVFQEVVFAKSITVLYGNSRIIWEYFSALEMIFADPRYHELVTVFTYTGKAFTDRQLPGLHQFTIMDQTRRERIDEAFFFRGLPLVELLVRTSMYEVTEAVDKIFAVLTCALHFEDDLKSMIDYSVPLRETLLRVAHYQLDSNQLLRSLHFAGIGWTDHNKRAKIPSWVVDVGYCVHDYDSAEGTIC